VSSAGNQQERLTVEAIPGSLGSFLSGFALGEGSFMIVCRKRAFAGSHLSYAGLASRPDQGVVKLHGVFLSCRGKPASSRVLQFRRALGRDSAQVVMPFVRVGTYPTRNFATLGPL